MEFSCSKKNVKNEEKRKKKKETERRKRKRVDEKEEVKFMITIRIMMIIR